MGVRACGSTAVGAFEAVEIVLRHRCASEMFYPSGVMLAARSNLEQSPKGFEKEMEMERREVLKVLTKAAGGTLLPASAPSLLARLTGHSTGMPGDLLADQSSSKDRRGARRQAVNYVNPFIGTTGAGLRWMLPAPVRSGGSYSSFGQPAPYVTGYVNVAPFFGTSRNDVSGPGNWRLNASLFKDFILRRERYVELHVDAFNVLNHPSFGQPGNTTTNIRANVVAITGPTTNQSNTVDARFLQLSRKVVF